jgi:hypothetical protein
MRKKLEKPILAEGETTGHAHVIEGVEVFEEEGIREFATKTPATVKHEEHKTVEIPSGNWQSDKVVEYDHFAEEAKKVRD